jgi:hypothetical protein
LGWLWFTGIISKLPFRFNRKLAGALASWHDFLGFSHRKVAPQKRRDRRYPIMKIIKRTHFLPANPLRAPYEHGTRSQNTFNHKNLI